MLKLKGCPKCKGDILLDRDHYGWYEYCIQCGHNRDMESTIQVLEQYPERETTGDIAGRRQRHFLQE